MVPMALPCCARALPCRVKAYHWVCSPACSRGSWHGACVSSCFSGELVAGLCLHRNALLCKNMYVFVRWRTRHTMSPCAQPTQSPKCDRPHTRARRHKAALSKLTGACPQPRCGAACVRACVRKCGMRPQPRQRVVCRLCEQARSHVPAAVKGCACTMRHSVSRRRLATRPSVIHPAAAMPMPCRRGAALFINSIYFTQLRLRH